MSDLHQGRFESFEQRLPLPTLREFERPGQEGVVAALGECGCEEQIEPIQQGTEGFCGLHGSETTQEICRIGLLTQIQHHQLCTHLHRLKKSISAVQTRYAKGQPQDQTIPSHYSILSEALYTYGTETNLPPPPPLCDDHFTSGGIPENTRWIGSANCSLFCSSLKSDSDWKVCHHRLQSTMH
jgi:hypothetical protein